MLAFGSIAALALSACAGAGGGSAQGAAGSSALPALAAAVTATNVAGQYKGALTDGAFGKGAATVNLSQRGRSAGGWIKVKFASTTLDEAVAMTLDPAKNTLAGTAIANVANSACTFSMASTYDPKTFLLTGRYKAVHGCTGDAGTFTAKERCYYVNHAMRPDVHGLQAC